MFITQGAAAEAQEDLKDALLVTQFVAVAVTNPFLQHMYDPLTFHFMLEKQNKKTSQSDFRDTDNIRPPKKASVGQSKPVKVKRC